MKVRREAFDWVIGEVETKFNQSVVQEHHTWCSTFIKVVTNTKTPSLTDMSLGASQRAILFVIGVKTTRKCSLSDAEC